MAGVRRHPQAHRRDRGGRRAIGVGLLAVAALSAVAVLVLRLAPVGPRPVDVFFVRYDSAGHSGTLVAVSRAVPPAGASVRLEEALRALLAGPTPEEQRRGLRSEIPDGTALRTARIERGVAAVDLTGAFAHGGGSSSILARVWQIVYTTTQFRGVSAVQITLDGQHVKALGGEGVVIDAPLRRPATAPRF